MLNSEVASESTSCSSLEGAGSMPSKTAKVGTKKASRLTLEGHSSEEIAAWLSRLSPLERSAAVMRFELEGNPHRSYAEMATILGINTGYVSYLVSTGFKKLGAVATVAEPVVEPVARPKVDAPVRKPSATSNQSTTGATSTRRSMRTQSTPRTRSTTSNTAVSGPTLEGRSDKEIAQWLDVLTPLELNAVVLSLGLDDNPPLPEKAVGNALNITQRVVGMVVRSALAKLGTPADDTRSTVDTKADVAQAKPSRSTSSDAAKADSSVHTGAAAVVVDEPSEPAPTRVKSAKKARRLTLEGRSPEEIEAWLPRLSELERRAAVRRFGLQGHAPHSNAEVAEALGIKVGYAQVLASNGFKKFGDAAEVVDDVPSRTDAGALESKLSEPVPTGAQGGKPTEPVATSVKSVNSPKKGGRLTLEGRTPKEIEAWLSRLSPPRRKAAVLRFGLEGNKPHSNQEVADTLRIKVGYAGVLVSDGFKKLDQPVKVAGSSTSTTSGAQTRILPKRAATVRPAAKPVKAFSIDDYTPEQIEAWLSGYSLVVRSILTLSLGLGGRTTHSQEQVAELLNIPQAQVSFVLPGAIKKLGSAA